MKRRIALMIITVGCILLTGCGSSVSQEEYDSLKMEYDSLSRVNDDLMVQIDELKTKYEELVEEKAEMVKAKMETSIPRAWATTYFGDDCLIMFTEESEYLQVICQKNFSVSLEGVRDAYNSVLASMPGLGVYQDQIKFNRMGVKFLQDSGKELLEFVFVKRDGEYILESINGDLENSSVISVALTNISK